MRVESGWAYRHAVHARACLCKGSLNSITHVLKPQPVLQVEPPKDPETYIHRSGRTGRAGHTGVCITLVGRKHEDRIPWIERKAGGWMCAHSASQCHRAGCCRCQLTQHGTEKNHNGDKHSLLALKEAARVFRGCHTCTALLLCK